MCASATRWRRQDSDLPTALLRQHPVDIWDHAHSISATPSQEAQDDAEPAPVRLRSHRKRRDIRPRFEGARGRLRPGRQGRARDRPLARVNAIRDVAIAGGRIAAVEANIAADAAEVIDATGKIVVPGLLDVHTHYARDTEGPTGCLSDGVTGWIDAGSEGADSDRRPGDDREIGAAARPPAHQHRGAPEFCLMATRWTSPVPMSMPRRRPLRGTRDFVVGVKARLTEASPPTTSRSCAARRR